jgi:predicted ABC-class ATPase
LPKNAAYLAVREILQESRVTQILDFLRCHQLKLDELVKSLDQTAL